MSKFAALRRHAAKQAAKRTLGGAAAVALKKKPNPTSAQKQEKKKKGETADEAEAALRALCVSRILGSKELPRMVVPPKRLTLKEAIAQGGYQAVAGGQ